MLFILIYCSEICGVILGSWNFSVLENRLRNNWFICDGLVFIMGRVFIVIFVWVFLMGIFKLFSMVDIILLRLVLVKFLFCVVMCEKVNKLLINIDMCLVVLSILVRKFCLCLLSIFWYFVFSWLLNVCIFCNGFWRLWEVIKVKFFSLWLLCVSFFEYILSLIVCFLMCDLSIMLWCLSFWWWLMVFWILRWSRKNILMINKLVVVVEIIRLFIELVCSFISVVMCCDCRCFFFLVMLLNRVLNWLYRFKLICELKIVRVLWCLFFCVSLIVLISLLSFCFVR